jgi:Zn-dependent protease with chaperone function
MIQAFYYPFTGTESLWWQWGPLATLGLVFGFPAFWIWEGYFHGGAYHEVSFWLTSGAYIVVFYLAVRATSRLRAKRKTKRMQTDV